MHHLGNGLQTLQVVLDRDKWYLYEEPLIVLVFDDLICNFVRNYTAIFCITSEKLIGFKVGLKWTFAALSVEVNYSHIRFIL